MGYLGSLKPGNTTSPNRLYLLSVFQTTRGLFILHSYLLNVVSRYISKQRITKIVCRSDIHSNLSLVSLSNYY